MLYLMHRIKISDPKFKFLVFELQIDRTYDVFLEDADEFQELLGTIPAKIKNNKVLYETPTELCEKIKKGEWLFV